MRARCLSAYCREVSCDSDGMAPMHANVWFAEMQITGTFKHRKVEFVSEGFDVTKLSDPIYVRDDKAKTYTRVTEAVYADIVHGRMRF